MKKIISMVLGIIMIATCLFSLCACSGGSKVIMLWGPEDHRELYLKWAEEFKAQHPDELKGYTFDFAGNGDAGAYSNMSIDPTKGAAIYTFANDQMANLANLNALSPLSGSDLEWAKANNIEAAVEATKLGEKYMAYPLQADNGYYLYYNKEAFEGTSVWDAEKGDLKEGYTFRDLYAALDEKTDNWKNGLVSWPFGDSWYVSGVFFAVGGDFDVKYDSEGKQVSASCSFGYTLPEGKTNYRDGDYTLGEIAVQCMLNTFRNADGTINPHFKYTDGDKVPYNDTVSTFTNPENPQCQETPFAACINGTWKAAELHKNWGDNYAATVLPMVEDDAGNKYAMRTFAGYKHLGVNPMCEFAQKKPENIVLLHQLAQFLSDKEAQIDRYHRTGAGPSNKAALADPTIASDTALVALNAQYARTCMYPEGTTLKDTQGNSLAGKPVGNGLGFRVQDSVPANYWTPISNFAQTMWQEYSSGTLNAFSQKNLHKTLAQLQMDVEAASQ